jgi:hypothetical protein
MSQGTHTAIGAPDLGDMLHFARDGVALQLGDLQLMPFTLNSTLPSTFPVIGDPRLNEINGLRWFLC